MFNMKKLSLEGLKFIATEIDITNNIMTITLNRPEKKNALNNVMMNEINYALAYAKQEKSVGLLYLLQREIYFVQVQTYRGPIRIQMFQN